MTTARYLTVRTATTLGALLMAIGASGQVPQDTPPAQWAEAVQPALEAYRAEDWPAAERLSIRIRQQSDDPRVRRQAAALAAMCNLHQPARDTLIAARSRLADLLLIDDMLAASPECHLALGIGQLELTETASALEELDYAVKGFARRDMPQREMVALVALADAWLRHTEWELTPTLFGVGRPITSAARDAVRRAQVAKIRDRLVELGHSRPQRARVDLLLARYLIAHGEDPEGGREILRRIASAVPLTTAGAEAGLDLAAWHATRGELDAATRWYRDVMKLASDRFARRAEQQLRALTAPRIDLEVPAVSRTTAPVRLALRTRGLAPLNLEVRAVNIDAWLDEPGTRGNDAHLPESGSLMFARDFDADADRSPAWWSAPSDALRFTAPPGAYAVLVQGRDADDRTHAQKQLLLVSDLRVVGMLDPVQGAMWAEWVATSDVRPDEPLTGSFWMTHSFAPTAIDFTEHVGRFTLPPEANVSRDPTWVALVRSGGHLALSRGALPPRGSATAEEPRVALIAGPPELSVGEQFWVAGALFMPGNETADSLAGQTIDLRVVNTEEQVLHTERTTILPGGVVRARITVTPDMRGTHLRVLARRDGRALAPLDTRPHIRVPADNDMRLRVTSQTSQPQSMGDLIAGQTHVTVPWTATPVYALVSNRLEAAWLPSPGLGPVHGRAIERRNRTNSAGTRRFEVWPEQFEIETPPLAIWIRSAAITWFGGRGASFEELILGESSAHAWIQPSRAEPVVGHTMQFLVGWFDPQCRRIDSPPKVNIYRDQEHMAALRTYPHGDGLITVPWRAPSPGVYQVNVELPDLERDPLSAALTLQISDSTDEQEAPPVRLFAHSNPPINGRSFNLALEGRHERPLLLSLMSGERIADVRRLSSLDGRTEIDWTVPDAAHHPLRVLALGWGDPGAAQMDTVRVELASNERVDFASGDPAISATPGRTLAVNIRKTSDDNAVARPIALVARLVREENHTQPLSRRWPDPPAPVAGPQALVVVAPDGRELLNIDTRPIAGPHVAEDLISPSLNADQTLWCTARSVVTRTARLAVPMPPEAGIYKLIITTIGPRGEATWESKLIDARAGITAKVHLPVHAEAGDVVHFAAVIENGWPAATQAMIELDSSPSLKLQRLRVHGAVSSAPRSVAVREPFELTLPPEGALQITGFAKTLPLGQGRVSLRVRAHDEDVNADATLRIHDTSRPRTPDAPIHIQRSLAVWAETGELEFPNEQGVYELGPFHDLAEAEAFAAQTGQPLLGEPRPVFDWLPLASGTPTEPGLYIQVREEVTVSKSLRNVLWLQRAPAVCVLVPADSRASDPPGTWQDDRSAEQVLEISARPPGTFTHEYTLAIVRPGTVAIPPPEVLAEGAVVPVTIDSERLELLVEDE